MHVRLQREGRGVMAEPHLHLLGVRARPEEEGRARVAEGMESCPREPGFARGRLHNTVKDVRTIEWLTISVAKDQLSVSLRLRCPQRLRHSGRQGHLPNPIAALGWR